MLARSALQVDGAPDVEDKVRRLDTDDHLILAAYERVLICVWRDRPRIDLIRRFAKQVDAMAARGLHGAIIVVEPHDGLPAPSERAALGHVWRDIKVNFIGLVYEGSGFRLAAMRSVVTAITLLVKQPHPARVFASVAQAATWATRECPAAGTAEALTQAVACARRVG